MCWLECNKKRVRGQEQDEADGEVKSQPQLLPCFRPETSAVASDSGAGIKGRGVMQSLSSGTVTQAAYARAHEAREPRQGHGHRRS